MFDINTIKNLKCLICRQNLVELEDREDNKCLTKKDYKKYLNDITKLECNHYYHISCLKCALINDPRNTSYSINLSKKCPYCNKKINRIISYFKELNNNNELNLKYERKNTYKTNENNATKRERCLCITNSGEKCKLFEKSPGSKYCRIHYKFFNEKKTICIDCNESNKMTEDTSIFSNIIQC